MARKRIKAREKLGNFENWEIEFMKNGPPPFKEWSASGHGLVYLDGRPIWERLQREPNFKASDFPWGNWAFEGGEKPQSDERG